MMHSKILLALAAASTAAASFEKHITHRTRARIAARKSANLPSGWVLQSSCVTDVPPPNRVLSNSTNLATNTPATCISQCEKEGYTFAGVQFGAECWCGNRVNGGAIAAASECMQPCAGDAAQTCGGNWHTTIYAKSAGSSAAPTSTSAPSSTSAPATTATSKWKIKDAYQGSNFFDQWSFFSDKDPTQGLVNYQKKADAMNKGLAYIQPDGVAVIKVDDKTSLPMGANRDSVRIATNKAYDNGLFIFDILEMPHGCSIWGAAWTVGPNWPNLGEIDILEGVNNSTQNQFTLHTGGTTTCTTANVDALSVTGKPMGTVCASGDGHNAGCAFADPESDGYGAGFNAVGGSVLAMLMDASGIQIWRFPRSNIPADISAQKPVPTSWGKPKASFPTSSSCPTSSNVKQQQIVFDITLCGSWAGDAYGQSGCPGSCAAQVMDPANYQTASWKIKSVLVYQ